MHDLLIFIHVVYIWKSRYFKKGLIQWYRLNSVIFIVWDFFKDKKSLKIPKGQSEYVHIEEKQTTQWPKAEVQKDKQRSTKHAYKTKDRVARTPLKPGTNSGAPEG